MLYNIRKCSLEIYQYIRRVKYTLDKRIPYELFHFASDHINFFNCAPFWQSIFALDKPDNFCTISLLMNSINCLELGTIFPFQRTDDTK